LGNPTYPPVLATQIGEGLRELLVGEARAESAD
jgi:hypothetical protein